MNPQPNIERLNTLADFLDTLEPEQFYFGDFVKEYNSVHACATVACALGYAPAVWPEQWYWNETRMPRLRESIGYVETDAQEFFGLSEREVGRLFIPYHSNYLGDSAFSPRATASEVAANIRAFIKTLA